MMRPAKLSLTFVMSVLLGTGLASAQGSAKPESAPNKAAISSQDLKAEFGRPEAITGTILMVNPEEGIVVLAVRGPSQPPSTWIVVPAKSVQDGDAPMSAQNNPPARVARLSYVKGSVSLQPSGENQWSQAAVNYTVTTGDRIYTDQGSRAELELGPYAVRLSETTDLTMANLNDQTMQLGLAQGTIRVSVFQLPSGNTVEIDTPNGALTVLGLAPIVSTRIPTTERVSASTAEACK